MLFQEDHNDNWDAVNWSLDDVITEEFDYDLDDLPDGLDDRHEYGKNLDFFSKYQAEISKIDTELVRRVDQRGTGMRQKTERQFNSDQEDTGNMVHLKLTTGLNNRGKENENNTSEEFDKEYQESSGLLDVGNTVEAEVNDPSSDILTYIEDMWDFIVEKNDMMTEELSSEVNKISLYIMDIFAQVHSTLAADDFGFAWIAGYDFSEISIFFNGLLENGMEAIATVKTALEDCIEYDSQWIPQYLIENLMALKEYVVNKAYLFFVFPDNLPFDMSYAKSLVYSFYDDTMVAFIKLTDLFFTYTGSVCNTELVTILRQETTEPMLTPLFYVYDHYISHVVQCVIDIQYHILSEISDGLSSVYVEYLPKVKKASDNMTNGLLIPIRMVSGFVQRCNIKEYLLSVAKSFLQDPKFWCLLIWVIVYLILALSLLYYSYICCKVTMLFSLFLMKVAMKCIAFFFTTVLQVLKGKPKLLESGAN